MKRKRLLLLLILMLLLTACKAEEKPTKASPKNTSAIKAKKDQIFNTQKNEKGAYTNGQPGDQTGREARVMTYPSYYQEPQYPWTSMLHCVNEKVRQRAVTNALAAAKNDHIGYDTGSHRLTLWQEVAKAGNDFDKVDTPCDADCATSALAFYKAAGYTYHVTALENIDPNGHVWTIEEILMSTGLFERRTGEEYLHTLSYGQPGDLYVAKSRHVIMQVS